MSHKYEARTCIDCGKELFVRADSRTVRCSHCRIEKRRKDAGSYIFCKNCGKEFQRRRSTTEFCSNECVRQYRSKTRKSVIACDYCGKPFERANCHIHEHNFCSVFCCGKWAPEHRVAENHPNWAGGKYHQDGYIFIHLEDGSVMAEHRYVMEKVLGRKLLPSEVVHHIDLDKQNNDPSNLMVVSRSEHAKIHEELLKMSRNNEALQLGRRTATVYWVAQEEVTGNA